MLLFKPEHIPMIKNRTKTQTRRKWKRCRVKIGSIHQVKIDFKKGSGPLAWVRITAARQERLKDISDADCIAEGYPDRIEYLDAFVRINHLENADICTILNEEVWVVDFELVDKPVMRMIIPVIDQMLTKIPAPESYKGKTDIGRLDCGLKSIKTSALYTAPEAVGKDWNNCFNLLCDVIGVPVEDWQYELLSIFSTRSVDELHQHFAEVRHAQSAGQDPTGE